MAGTNVDVSIRNWTNEGVNVPVPKYSVTVELYWDKPDGSKGHYQAVHYFPNDLQGIPLSRLKQYMADIIEKEARIALGIDEV